MKKQESHCKTRGVGDIDTAHITVFKDMTWSYFLTLSETSSQNSKGDTSTCHTLTSWSLPALSHVLGCSSSLGRKCSLAFPPWSSIFAFHDLTFSCHEISWGTSSASQSKQCGSGMFPKKHLGLSLWASPCRRRNPSRHTTASCSLQSTAC